MKKKIVLIVLAVVLLLSCGIGAWLHFRQPEREKDAAWVPAMRIETQPGALSDLGYYYVPWIGEKSLHYTDFGTGKSVALCSQPACDHSSRECDAYIGHSRSIMFYYRERLYYTMNDEPVLYRRDAIGMSMAEVGTVGKRFIEQQKSVSFGNVVPVDGWMYYQATVSAEDENGIKLTEMTYIGRLNLSTGKDEVLLQETGNNKMMLYAARSGSVLYARWETAELDTSAPDYKEKFRQLKVTLEQYDPEIKRSAVLFEKKRAECQEILMVWDDKVYCANYPIDGFTNTFVYDLKTGEYTLQYENAMLRHLGGGYAFYKDGPDGKYKLLNMATGELLENCYEANTPHASNKSDLGVVLWFTGEKLEDGSSTVAWRYVPYAELSDGLQETDLIEANAAQTSPSKPQNPTTPTDPPNSEFEELQTLFPKWEVSYAKYQRKPDDQLKINVQKLPETVENPQGLPVLKWVCILDNSSRVWTEEAVHEANQLLADRNMPFRVQFVMITTEAQGTQADLFSRTVVQEALQEADLVCTRMGQAQMKQYLMPITDYASTTLKNAVPHPQDWLRTTVGGEIYGITNNALQASWDAWAVKADAMEDLGLNADVFRRNYWEMDEIFAKIYEKNGKKPFLLVNLDGVFNPTYNYEPGIREGIPESMSYAGDSYQLIGMHYVIDHTSAKPKVVSILESDRGRKIWEATMRYRKAGYITEISDQSLLWMSGSTTDEVFLDTFFDCVVIPFGEASYIGTDGRGQSMTGVAATSKLQEQAVALLQLLADDEAFRDQLCFGKEGRDYKLEKEEFGSYSTIKREDGAYYSMTFLSPYASNLSQVTKDEGNWIWYCSEGKTRLETYRDNKDKVTVIYCPAEFDLTGYEDKMTAIGKILGPYFIGLHNTVEVKYEEDGIILPAMTPAVYEQMLQEVREAGGDEIRDELQRQLDEWLANNPDWQ